MPRHDSIPHIYAGTNKNGIALEDSKVVDFQHLSEYREIKNIYGDPIYHYALLMMDGKKLRLRDGDFTRIDTRQNKLYLSELSEDAKKRAEGD